MIILITLILILGLIFSPYALRMFLHFNKAVIKFFPEFMHVSSGTPAIQLAPIFNRERKNPNTIATLINTPNFKYQTNQISQTIKIKSCEPMKKMKTITPAFMQMKTFKALFYALALLFISVNTMAQGNANLSDFHAIWSGTGDDGNTYTLTLNSNNTATLKSGTTSYDVVAYKFAMDAGGGIAYDKRDHVALTLISNVLATNSGSASNQTTLSEKVVAGTPFKTYVTDVYYETATDIITLSGDLSSPAAGASSLMPVIITFTK